MSARDLKIGCASGFWGDSSVATPQLLRDRQVQFIVYDYLAEITMSIMARARAENSQLGYATDFVNVILRQNLEAIADKGIKLVANAGGVNPEACGRAIEQLIVEKGLTLKVAIVEGDDLI